ncbi:SDR family NAD(P)-dependent oxidoreductase [Hymenobacter sp. 15J16-1T3B]|uniref:SDR family NAD(P)-dependent oxidoreductase n=1 Tax=Hymenobacter sp. 15J16-1T3B TaxID=2886941 RepID=UPI001D11B532|nr:SDR family NAD(P)-dependent oxidoreductase [Hymenobacter sp. 15J16-1T3B]MCC3157137.1 SDR family NAD(P)-dependent oxidoreductase [Hymenobacter sp. 15J16-1T3B]
MHKQLVALVTGANQGIGLELAKALAAHDYTVLVGARNLAKGEAAAWSIGANAQALQLDVTDPASIRAAAARIREQFGRLDLLVNNAAISNTQAPGTPFEEILQAGRPSVAPLDEVRAVFETNVFGVIAVTQALLPLLREAPAARIVNVSSGVGSLTLNADPAFPYRQGFSVGYPASKTALNAVTLAFAIELEGSGIKVNAVSPGFTATALNNFAGTESVEQGAQAPIRMALDQDAPTGTFSGPQGPLPW